MSTYFYLPHCIIASLFSSTVCHSLSQNQVILARYFTFHHWPGYWLTQKVSVRPPPPPANYDHQGIFRGDARRYALAHRWCWHPWAIWRYMNGHADFEKACDLLENLYLVDNFVKNKVENCLLRWKRAFMDIMSICVPKTVLPDKSRPPWLSKPRIQSIRKRNLLFKKATTGSVIHIKGESTRSKVCYMFCQSKRAYFEKKILKIVDFLEISKLYIKR